MTAAHLSVGSRIRKSPFYDSTVAAGASAFTIYNHMYMPTGYGDPAAEYQRVTAGVALWDVAVERQVEIAGPDAFTLANYLSARDLTGMAVGRARYAPMCDHEGRLINDPVILRVADDRYWFSLADSEILLWARSIAGERGLDVQVFEPDVSPLAIQGPLANDLGRDLFGADVADNLGFFHHTPVELDGIPIQLCRSGWSRQGGFELFLTNGADGNRLWDLVMDAGAKYDIGPGNPNHQERIESGLLSYGSDHAADTDPIEAGLEAYVSLASDHQFVGRAALEARMQRSIRNNLVNIRIEGEPVPSEHPWLASVDQTPIGYVQTATWSPRLNTWIGIAQLSTPNDAPGTSFDVMLPSGEKRSCQVHHEPFGATQTS